MTFSTNNHFAFYVPAVVFAATFANTQLASAQDACFKTDPPYACYSPGDVDPSTFVSPTDYSSLYSAYAEMAWQDFIALNWPAKLDAEGNPTTTPSTMFSMKKSSGSYTTVWEAYPTARDIFRAGGAQPIDFGGGHVLPEACQNVNAASSLNNQKDVATTFTRVIDEYIQAGRMGPVTDVNGWYTRFGISFNGPMYNYTVNNNLYSAAGQETFDESNTNRSENLVQWPRGVYSTLNSASDIGSIFVKASWRILSDNDDPQKYHTIRAYIYNKAGGAFGQEPTVPESCTLETVGMVGFHITHRTNSSPQWVWSTFEHVDNAPWIHDFKKGTPTGSFGYFDPSSCPASADGSPSCQYNQLPSHPWSPQGSKSEITQMIRIGAPGKIAEAANGKYKALIEEFFAEGPDNVTPWKHYFLVDVQFPTKVNFTNPETGYAEINPAYPDGLPTPTFLPNATIETYIQGFGDTGQPIATSNGNNIPIWDKMQNVDTVPGGSKVDPFTVSTFNRSGGAARETSSCMSCHTDAALVTGSSAGFVFSLGRAE